MADAIGARTLSPEQVAALVIARGFADPVRATAVVLGESGGNPAALNTSNADGTEDVGLWQINSGHFPGGKYDAGRIDRAGALDVVRSTNFAYELSNGGANFGAWSATRRSTFGQHMRTAQSAVAAARQAPSSTGSTPAGWKLPVPDLGDILRAPLGPAGGLLPNPAGVIDGAQDALKLGAKLLAALLDPTFWKRVGLGLLGVGLAALGVVIWRRRELGTALMAAPHPAAKAGGAALASSDSDDAVKAAAAAT